MDLFTTGDGCRLAYRIDGPADKATIMLSNSIGTTHRMWDAQIPAFTRNFRVLRYDTRGHGASDAPSGPYSIDRLGYDTIELLDALQIDKVHFCGLSMGGMTGQWLGIHHPDRIHRLVLASTSTYLGPRDAWDEQIKTVRDSPDPTNAAEGLLRFWLSVEALGRGDLSVDTLRDDLLATSPAGLIGGYAALRDADFRNTASLICQPTLVIGGQFDQPEQSRQLATIIRRSRLVMLPSRHLSNVEHSTLFNNAVLDFLTAAA